jgi:hypothetical protein
MADSDYTRPSGVYGQAFQERRLEALARDHNRCCACNHDGSVYRLEVHHRTYENGTDPKLEDLYTFCVRCHDVWTDIMRGDRYDARVHKTPEYQGPPPGGRPVPESREDPVIVEIRPTVAVKIHVPEKATVQVQEYQSRPRTKPNL